MGGGIINGQFREKQDRFMTNFQLFQSMQSVHSLNLNLTETVCSFIRLIYIKDIKLREQLTIQI